MVWLMFHTYLPFIYFNMNHGTIQLFHGLEKLCVPVNPLSLPMLCRKTYVFVQGAVTHPDGKVNHATAPGAAEPAAMRSIDLRFRFFSVQYSELPPCSAVLNTGR